MKYRPRDTAITSRVMAAIPNKNNLTEVALRKELHRRGLRYRVHSRAVLGQPDIFFPTEKLAVFVDGDYWHGRALREGGEAAFYVRFKTARKDFWKAKLQRNIDRDTYVTAGLREQGWTVLRFWESEAASALIRTADEIERALRARRRYVR